MNEIKNSFLRQRLVIGRDTSINLYNCEGI